MGTHQPIRKTVVPEIPDKLYFRIGDVSKLCEVPAYVLRFWETEFPQLKPNKGGTGQRLYRRRDVEMALRIKSLLYDQGYTIPGARQVFKAETAKAQEVRGAAAVPDAKPESRLAEVRAPEASIAPAPENTLVAMRRLEKLKALRAELQSLAASLAQPVARPLSLVPREGLAVTLQSVRPRLAVVEKPRSPAERLAAAQLSLEGDLF